MCRHIGSTRVTLGTLIRGWLGRLFPAADRKPDLASWLARAEDVGPKPTMAAVRDLGPSEPTQLNGATGFPDNHRTSKSRAAIITAFDTSRPVSRRDDLFGRTDALQKLLEQIVVRGGHGIVYGARGSGKTSLVRAFGDYADEQGFIVLYDESDGRANFAQLIRPLLREIPASALLPQQRANFEAGLASEDARLDARIAARMLSMIEGSGVILIFDEFDRVDDRDVQEEVATFLKMVSDMRLPVAVLLAGIAKSVSDLISAHPSLSRHLAAVPVRPLSIEDSKLLMRSLGDRAGVSFDEPSFELLASISCGSPYHLRLFAMHAGLAAKDGDKSRIDRPALAAGARTAFDDWAALNPEPSEICRRCATLDVDSVRDIGIVATAVAAASGGGVPFDDMVFLLAGRAKNAEARLDGVFNALASVIHSRKGMIGFDDMLVPQFLLAAMSFAHGLSSARLQRRGERA